MKVKDIFIYPIKSCQGISLKKAQIMAKGLRDYEQQKIYDRQFMLVDEKGKFITQRQYPKLATIKIELKDNKLYLSSQKSTSSTFELIPNTKKKIINVNIWRDQTTAIDQGNEVANWFKGALELDINCRLVQQSDDYIRPIDPKYSTQANQPVSFSDGYPFLLTNTASLNDLRQHLSQKYPQQKIAVTMNSFRPNIVVETNEPFIEDTWKNITIGKVKFAVVKPCSRCIVTTTDQKTGERNELKEPLLTLSTFRRTPDGVMFGQNLIALDQHCLNIDDKVNVN